MFEALGEWSALDRGTGPRRYVLVTPRGRYLDMPEAAYQLDQHLRAGFPGADGLGGLHEAVGQGALAVVDVRDDGEVADVHGRPRGKAR